MNRLCFLVMLVIGCPALSAQTHLRIHHTGGNHTDVPVAKIDSLTFVDGDSTPADEATLTGSWFWGSVEKGYYETLTFNDDRTYTGYDYYIDYGFETTTYGTYFNSGIMLNLWSNGYGYHRTYRWFLTCLTGNALEVMTPMGSFVYYRVMPDIITMNVGESVECPDGDAYTFADGVMVRIDGNRLYGVRKGTTYILKRIAETGLIYAYKVIVA